MMKTNIYSILLALISGVLCTCCNAQSHKSMCHELQESLGTPLFKKEFYVKDHPNKDLIIMDTSKVFSSCKVDYNIEGRKVILTEERYSKKQLARNPNIIQVFFGKKDCVNILTFFCEGHGRAVSFLLLEEDIGFEIIGYKTFDI